MARQLFTRNGLKNTTMNDIANASEKGRRTVYSYFRTKPRHRFLHGFNVIYRNPVRHMCSYLVRIYIESGYYVKSVACETGILNKSGAKTSYSDYYSRVLSFEFQKILKRVLQLHHIITKSSEIVK